MPAYTHTNRGNVQGQTPTPASPSRNNSPYQSPPASPRVSSRRTNPNPHSPHRRTNLLPRVLSPPDQSTASLLSLTHSSTSQRFSLAPMHSQAHPHSLSRPSLTYDSPSLPRLAYFDSVLPRTRARNRAASRRRRVQLSHIRLAGCPAPANSRPSPANFPSRHRRRLSGNRLLLAI
jgi:hypothetical protein